MILYNLSMERSLCIASLRESRSMAIEILMWPSMPKALPGTTATLAFSRIYNANSESFDMLLFNSINSLNDGKT